MGEAEEGKISCLIFICIVYLFLYARDVMCPELTSAMPEQFVTLKHISAICLSLCFTTDNYRFLYVFVFLS